MQTHRIHGTVAPGFEAVEHEFRRNFSERGELGAACAVYFRGEPVVDLWGGSRDLAGKLPWEADTLVMVFSTTKGMSGLALALAHSRGLLDYDEKVAAYWPEFAQNGKADVTVRQLLAHQAGLPVIDARLDGRLLADVETVSRALAAQKPAWQPGTRHGYHILSLGLYESELLRRVDPHGRRIGQFFHDEIATPLGLEFYIGLPDSVPSARIAQIKEQQVWRYLLNLHKVPRAVVFEIVKPNSLLARGLFNPRLSRAVNSRDVQRVELASGIGIGRVRDIARAYSEFVTGGQTLGLRPETLAALSQPAQPPSGGTFDLVMQIDAVYSLGFLRPSHGLQFGSEQAFGHTGAGGSFAFADPKHQLAFAYAMNRMDYYLRDDPREIALRSAVYRCIAALP
jgi:CubicO group peptidase (beta-lactamase class C family)